MANFLNKSGDWTRTHLAELIVVLCTMSLISVAYTHVRTDILLARMQRHMQTEEPFFKSVVDISEILKKSPLERYGEKALGGVTDKDIDDLKDRLETLQGKINTLETRVDLVMKMRNISSKKKSQ